jgi:hypothetical protein
MAHGPPPNRMIRDGHDPGGLIGEEGMEKDLEIALGHD